MNAVQTGEMASTIVPPIHWARTVDGACIAYQDIGTGPVTLVVTHGWVSHLEVYWEQPRYVRFLRRLARNMRVLVFDKRGIGMSDRVSGTPDIGTLADDVRAVMDAAGIEKAALLGWGGPGPELPVFFAATHPERTHCFVLFGEVHERREPDYPWGLTDEEQESYWRAFTWDRWGTEQGARDFISAGYLDGAEITRPPYSDPDFIAWNAKLARFAATPTSFQVFDQMWFETDVRPLLGSITAPTLVLYPMHSGNWEQMAHDQAQRIPGAKLAAVTSPEGVIWMNDPEPIVTSIESFVTSVQNEEAELDRVLATVLFTDVVGSTDRACELGDRRWTELLERHNQTVRALLARYRGSEVNTAGDGFLATFDGPARAVKCAQGICQAVRPLGLEVRAACHTGEIELLEDDVGGIAVHIGARVGGLAGPSEVLVTSTVKDLVAGSGLTFSYRGEHHLKGVDEPWRLYAVAQD